VLCPRSMLAGNNRPQAMLLPRLIAMCNAYTTRAGTESSWVIARRQVCTAACGHHQYNLAHKACAASSTPITHLKACAVKRGDLVLTGVCVTCVACLGVHACKRSMSLPAPQHWTCSMPTRSRSTATACRDGDGRWRRPVRSPELLLGGRRLKSLHACLGSCCHQLPPLVDICRLLLRSFLRWANLLQPAQTPHALTTCCAMAVSG
jgi:hypothetical protein